MAEIILKGRLKGYQRAILPYLLNMMYRPSEIAEEIGFTTRQFYRVYIPLGCPHERDKRNHIWINGIAFAAWYEITYAKATLKDNEAYCQTCRKPVKMTNKSKHRKGELTYWICNCSICDRRLARIIDKDKRGYD